VDGATIRWFAAIAIVLMIVGALSPAPDRVTDRGTYEAMAAQIIVPDCSDLHCFRVLVPWTLGRLPGSSIVRWTAYAVVCNTAAALAVFVVSLTFGLTRRGAAIAAALSAFGFGSFYTLHDSYTADPLMFALGPWITNEVLIGRLAVATAAGTIGVLAKEFAAAPLYACAAYAAAQRRWDRSLRALAAGNLALSVWLTLTLFLMLRFNYSYGASDSANLAAGAAIGPWLQRQSVRGIFAAMFDEFGALYILAPVGLLVAPRVLRLLGWVSLPIAAVLCYVQQPDRALWNFHFLVTPLAALVLERVPRALAWTTVAMFAVANLRVGAQLPIALVGRTAVVGSLAAACAACAMMWKPRQTPAFA
jgi:hypothetical protein